MQFQRVKLLAVFRRPFRAHACRDAATEYRQTFQRLGKMSNRMMSDISGMKNVLEPQIAQR